MNIIESKARSYEAGKSLALANALHGEMGYVDAWEEYKRIGASGVTDSFKAGYYIGYLQGLGYITEAVFLIG